MKIRFLKSWPCVTDDEGAFQLHAVNHGPFGLTLAERVAEGVKEPPPPPRMVICAVYADEFRGSVGTCLCAVEFQSGEHAATAAEEGIEVVEETLAQSFARRAVAAGVAEQQA